MVSQSSSLRPGKRAPLWAPINLSALNRAWAHLCVPLAAHRRWRLPSSSAQKLSSVCVVGSFEACMPVALLSRTITCAPSCSCRLLSILNGRLPTQGWARQIPRLRPPPGILAKHAPHLRTDCVLADSGGNVHMNYLLPRGMRDAACSKSHTKHACRMSTKGTRGRFERTKSPTRPPSTACQCTAKPASMSTRRRHGRSPKVLSCDEQHDVSIMAKATAGGAKR